MTLVLAGDTVEETVDALLRLFCVYVPGHAFCQLVSVRGFVVLVMDFSFLISVFVPQLSGYALEMCDSSCRR